MTREEFAHLYPNGLNRIIVLFKKCMHEVMTGDEIDRLIKYTSGVERFRLKRFRKWYSENVDDWDFPFWVILPSITSQALLKDVITYMVINCESVFADEPNYFGEGEEIEIE